MNKIHATKEDKIIDLLSYHEALMFEKNGKERVQTKALLKYEKIKDKRNPKKKVQDQDVPEDIVESVETQRGLDNDEETKGEEAKKKPLNKDHNK